MTKLWGGRFSGETDNRVEAFTESISFDQRLYRHDILASQAIDVYENLQQSQPARIREALKPLDEAMSSLDFDQALSACRALEGTLIP